MVNFYSNKGSVPDYSFAKNENDDLVDDVLSQIVTVNKIKGLNYEVRLAELNELLEQLLSEATVPQKKEPVINHNGNFVEYPNIELTRIILDSGHFLESYESSKCCGFTVSEAQGSKHLRQQARLFTLDNPDILSPEALKEAKDTNKTNYYFLKLKRIGHAFSLEKDIKTTEKKFGYEGFSEDFTIPMLSSSLFKAERELKGDGKFRFAGEKLNRSFSNEWAPKEKLEQALKTICDLSSDEVVSIATGYAWHETHVLFFKGHLFYINKGNGKKQGISVYWIPNAEKVTMDHLIRLSERQKYNSENYLSEDKLIKELNLEPISSVTLKTQKGGCCTYVSTRGAIRALMAIFYQLNNPNYSKPGWKFAFEKTKEDYKKFVQFDRDLLLDDLKGEADDYEYFSRTDVLVDIFNRIQKKQNKYQREHWKMLANLK